MAIESPHASHLRVVQGRCLGAVVIEVWVICLWHGAESVVDARHTRELRARRGRGLRFVIEIAFLHLVALHGYKRVVEFCHGWQLRARR